MITEEDIQIFDKAIRKGAAIFLMSDEEDFEKNLFPIWRDAFHEFMKNHGCPCTKGDGKKCFLSLPNSVQIRLPGENYFSFNHYINILKEGKRLAISKLLATNN